MLTTEFIYGLSVWILPILLAAGFHEAAHAYTAFYFGDDTAKKLGRVTLNPFRHIDKYGTINYWELVDKEALAKEDCVLALEIATTIPDHVANLGEASEGAEEAYIEAVQVMEESEGLDLKLWNKRLESAKEHLDQGEFSLARGVSDGIIREVRKEREAMGDVQRALRQKKNIQKRWEGHIDADAWEERLKDVAAASKRKSWSHAAALLDRLTTDLDALDTASGDANELLTYVQDEWSKLRKKLEAAGIKAIDGERAACEKAVGNADSAYKEGRLEDTLTALGEADGLMEKLRRRV